LTNAATVNNLIRFPADWKNRWPDFFLDITRYKRIFKANKYHDGLDALTGIIEIELFLEEQEEEIVTYYNPVRISPI